MAVLMLGFTFGFTARLDFALSCVLLGVVVSVPAIWSMLRTSLIGDHARMNFLSFVEEKYGISATSWLTVSSVGVLVMLFGLARRITA